MSVGFRPGPMPPSLRHAVRAGFATGLALPVIPGWTAEAIVLEPWLDAAAAAGAALVALLAPARDGAARRATVEARAAEDTAAADLFFDVAHHGDWEARLPDLVAAVGAACERRGLATLPPRPRGAGEPAANARAAALLEERARETGKDEHRQALLHAAVRWIDECGRDLSGVVEEGNFRRVFPFGAELAGEAEAALSRRA